MEKLMLAMSGGVDSSAALLVLKDDYELIGGTLMLNSSENDDGLCGSSKDIEDAKAIAAKYGVPHFVFDMREHFTKTIKKSFIDSYLRGETPNPCVECNEIIKFGALLSKAKELGCDKIATGHYARVEYDENSGRFLLKKATDKLGQINPKDQSYVLYRLSQEQLAAAVFPLGRMNKNEIREIASKSELINSDKPDSQDICFVPNGSYGSFIENSLGRSYPVGRFIDPEGNVIGEHKGVIHYTIGQRRGIGVGFGRPLYVVDKNADKNTVTLGDGELLMKSRLTARELNWIAFEAPKSAFMCKAKTRYKQTEVPCTVIPTDNNTIVVEFEQPIRALTPGQHIVFYDGDTVLGGGVIDIT